jgi:pilus assembly protein CpaE
MDNAAEPIVVHVIGRDAGLLGRLNTVASACEREQGMRCKISQMGRMGEQSAEPPQLALIDLDSMSDVIMGQIPRFRQQFPNTWVVVTYQQPSAERLLGAMRSGANDYLSHTPTVEEFQAILVRASQGKSAVNVRPPGRIITVCSNKGGVGTTMVAINVAAALAARMPGAVAVVDLVLQHGDISVFLDIRSTYTVSNLVTELDRMDPSYLRSVLFQHAAGMYVLPAPHAPDEAELVSAGQISGLLQTLRNCFDAIVVDTGNEYNELTLAAFDAADKLFMVTLPDLPSIRNTKRSLELFERLHYDSSKLVLIVNRHDAQEKLARESMEEAMGRPVQWSIPNDYVTVVRSINQGTALRAIQPKGRLVANFDQLVCAHILDQANGGQPQAGPGESGASTLGKMRSLFRR